MALARLLHVRLARRESAPAREAMTLSMARVRTRVAEPVASHVEATRPFRRATERTPTEGGPVSSAVIPCRIRESGGDRVRLCGEVDERAKRHEGALRRRRAHTLRGVDEPPERAEGADHPLGGVHRRPGRAGGKDHVVKVRDQVVSFVTEEFDGVFHHRGV
jgi:hypothetical protein